MPLGFWVQDALDLARNHYDRLGHFAQGFVPAIAVREILIRTSPVTKGGWLAFLTVATCLAISATYEFVEWWTSLAAGVAADQFLATQGDIWDTHWDMFMALCGAIAALLLLSRVQRSRNRADARGMRWQAAQFSPAQHHLRLGAAHRRRRDRRQHPR